MRPGAVSLGRPTSVRHRAARSAMALRVVGRVRTLRRLVAAVVGLCDPKGSTAQEIVEWSAQHPCGATRCLHSPPQGNHMRKDRARLVAGLRYSVQKGVLEEHGGRYKLAMENGGCPQQGPRKDARPRISWSSRRSSHGSSSHFCACALAARPRAAKRHRTRHPLGTPTRRRAAAAARVSRRRQQPSRRRRATTRRLHGARDRARRRASRRPSAKDKPGPKDKAKDKGKGKGDASGGGGGGGGCDGCGERRADRPGEQRRASHLVSS